MSINISIKCKSRNMLNLRIELLYKNYAIHDKIKFFLTHNK